MNSILVFSVQSVNIEFYQKCFHKLNCKTIFVNSIRSYEYNLLHERFDLVLIDLELDSTDALSVIKETQVLGLRELPFIAVCSHKTDDFIQISALNNGADLFIELPLSPLIFESKIRALLRRTSHLRVNDSDHREVYIDHERFKVVIGDHDYNLPRLEFRLLDLLFSNPGQIFTKEEIALQIWHDKNVSFKRTIDIHIRNIRKELGKDFIQTFRGLGYSIKQKNIEF